MTKISVASRMMKASAYTISNYDPSVECNRVPMFPHDQNSEDGPCNENEDLDSQSNYSHNSLPGSMNKPIVVGYAFGPKKMSTMGVVLAEASRVKVIHEELSEDTYEDVEHDEEELICGQEDQTLLTSAALRGLEEQNSGRNRISGNEPESTIITIGNSNDTDLQHIVRYFRSNCSSAAASASIASVGETTVSTPTTTNSCQTYNNYKQRRSSRGEWNRFPTQISFVPLDPDQPLEEQHGGEFDLILHKLTEDILTCSLMQDLRHQSRKHCDTSSNLSVNNSQSEQEIENQQATDPSFRRVRALRDYCYRRNPRCCLVDDPNHVQTVMSRFEIATVLQRCLKGVKTTSGIPVKSPRFVVIPECSLQSGENPLQQHQSPDLLQELQDNTEGNASRLSSPLIIKPLIAAGTKQSHYMLIATHQSALTKLPPKSIVQEFVNHDATLYKVYVLGDFVNVYKRNSLPNLPSDLSDATVDLVEFDSQRPYPKLKDFGLDIEDKNDSKNCGNNQLNFMVTKEEVKPIVEVLKRAFGLELFGFDILIGSDNGEYFVVDVNYFPSYKEVPNFPSLLARYLTRRVLQQRRNGGVCCEGSNDTMTHREADSITHTTWTTEKESCGSIGSTSHFPQTKILER